jgi:hypothetical protein
VNHEHLEANIHSLKRVAIRMIVWVCFWLSLLFFYLNDLAPGPVSKGKISATVFLFPVLIFFMEVIPMSKYLRNRK